MSAAQIVATIVALYAAAGLMVAVPFVLKGVDRLAAPMSLTPGARLVLLPGATALWPYVLARWIGSTRRA